MCNTWNRSRFDPKTFPRYLAIPSWTYFTEYNIEMIPVNPIISCSRNNALLTDSYTPRLAYYHQHRRTSTEKRRTCSEIFSNKKTSVDDSVHRNGWKVKQVAEVVRRAIRITRSGCTFVLLLLSLSLCSIIPRVQ